MEKNEEKKRTKKGKKDCNIQYHLVARLQVYKTC